jgi:hypothetical protein
MADSLTESSRKRSRTQHADASHLTRKKGVYYDRCLLPEHPEMEVALSFGTRNFREAEPLPASMKTILLPMLTWRPSTWSLVRLASGLSCETSVPLRVSSAHCCSIMGCPKLTATPWRMEYLRRT